MIRRMLAVLLATTAVALPAHAQYADPHAMPGYDEREQMQPDGPDDRYDSADARNNGDPRDAAPPPPRPPQGVGQGASGQGWVEPPPYARESQVDQGTRNDAAHRADRAYTASLNHRAWPGRNATPDPTSGAAAGYSAQHARYQAELADHARAMQDYQADQARYAERIARWRARANACEAGNIDACQGPE